ncbi:class I SAM-dependent methyltransferase [Aneurinibacillus migulanus]|uniref:S-adenosyl-L-methionine-dependent methyltransferase n=1 Tax=Aneurinibacillus migulanus TaxID=47500 RepID=A0A0D1XEC7_ANEMI|nr:class I SAM-dependent methyltransferase [Aneurinibacillus migulanus]KIV50638.1 SAM-dependent methyltransferase [Aneurinibacillus migulanus]KON97449.1 SAM-dependent methyltransferase [Aneurinibacillus migulanus]MED0896116.1 class I SAM-dependent methyltransferase [Aneurinibacillus migulanus]MED1618544.1 class I SAM-dependent methyltransferase [Aneurinibacillus migulanus]SDK50047.1 methyltransferase, TIGR00027 family [Aneurinibacillus migulanus]
MKKGESSLTSLISAFGRSCHSQFDTPKIFNDYIAKDLISQKEFNNIKENMVQGIHFFNKDIVQKFKGDTEEILKWITQIQLSPTPLARAAYCEKVLLNEVMLELKQYVILGAGLDTFSFRHPELENTLEIFEIDYPTTQEFKKKRLDEANFKVPSNLHFVSMDFTKKFSYQNLRDEGFGNKKTFFSLLGVSYYLTKEEISSLIDNLFAKVPSGSSIVFDYADEKLFEEKGIFNRVENMVKMASASGEPMKSCFSYYEIERMLEKSGLLIYEHLSPDKINELYFDNRKDYLSAFETIHYIHAIKK